MWETTYMKVITIEAGTTTFIMVPDGDHFIHGTTHGITVVGTVHGGLTVAGIIHGIMDMVVCTEAGTDGTVLGTMDMVDGMILGITADTTEGIMVMADIMVMVAVIVMVFMTDIIAV